MFSEKRILAIVACIVLICAAVSYFSGSILDHVHPPPEVQFTGFEKYFQAELRPLRILTNSVQE